jgi:transcriptional regulator with XRE-family HTH domain
MGSIFPKSTVVIIGVRGYHKAGEMKAYLLKAERKLQGWSQAEVAQALGVSIRTVIRWEQGLVMPHPYYLHQLCNLFGKTAKELDLYSDVVENNVPKCSRQESFEESFLVDPSIPESQKYANSLLGRDGLFIQMKERLFAGDNVALTALGGLLGIGNTALAVALATDQEIRAHFCDGILWAGLGPRPNVLGQLTRWGKLLEIVPSQVKDINSREAWGRALRAAIDARQMLVVIEDAWTIQDALALQVGGTACAYLLTTRISQLAFACDQEAIIVPELKEADGLALLAHFVPELVEQDPQGGYALVRAVGCLPLALNLMGKYLASQTFIDQSWPLQAALALLRDTEQRLRVNLPTVSGDGLSSLAGVPLSLYAAIAICDQQLSPEAHAALCALAVFPPKPQSFSEETALAMGRQPREVLEELCDVGLLENWGSRRYTLHQAIADYTRA